MKKVNIIKSVCSRLAMLALLFIGQVSVASAEVRLYMEDFTIYNGEYKQVSLMLDNDKVATTLQAKLQLPAGLQYAGWVDVTDRTSRADVQASTATGKLVIVLTDAEIKAGEGAVVTFWVTTTGAYAEGDYNINLSDIIISDANADQINTEEENTATVSMLGLSYCKFAADDNIELTVGDEYQIDVTLDNAGVDNLTALEGKLTLPEGLEIVEGTDGKFIYSDRIPGKLKFKFQDFDGYTKFVLSSTSNTPINDTEGVIFSFKVKATKDLESVIKLEELRVAAETGASALLDDVLINVKVNKSYTLGDVDNDGEITPQDASLILQYLAGKVAAADIVLDAADVDGDTEVTPQDASLILQYLAGKISLTD